MADFYLRERGATLASPCNCFHCGGGGDGPFVDLFRELPYLGQAYLCERCVVQMAQLLGMVEKEKHQREVTNREERLRELEALLESERQHKFVSIGDLEEMFEKRTRQRPRQVAQRGA